MLLWSGVCLPLMGVAALALLVQGHQGLVPWDEQALQAIHAAARSLLPVAPWLDAAVLALTRAGSFLGVSAIALGLLTLDTIRQRTDATFSIDRTGRSLLYLTVALGGSALLNQGTKLMFHRLRPHLWDVISPLQDFSFPSGHATLSMTLVVALLLLWRSRFTRWTLAAGLVYVLLIGGSRMYLGVHFPSDILAGWLLAIAWAVSAHWLVAQLQQRGAKPLP